RARPDTKEVVQPTAGPKPDQSVVTAGAGSTPRADLRPISCGLAAGHVRPPGGAGREARSWLDALTGLASTGPPRPRWGRKLQLIRLRCLAPARIVKPSIADSGAFSIGGGPSTGPLRVVYVAVAAAGAQRGCGWFTLRWRQAPSAAAVAPARGCRPVARDGRRASAAGRPAVTNGRRATAGRPARTRRASPSGKYALWPRPARRPSRPAAAASTTGTNCPRWPAGRTGRVST